MTRSSIGCLVLLALVSLATNGVAGTVTPTLSDIAASLAPGERVPVLINLAERVDVSRYDRGRATAPALITDLKETASRTQAGVLDYLRTQGLADEAKAFWITNTIAVSVTRAQLDALAARADVWLIEHDGPGGAPEVVRGEEGGTGGAAEWGLMITGIDDVWSIYGLDGTGVVIGSMDTGVDASHPALAGKWRGGTNSWVDIQNGLTVPYDDHGHGTHTIGTLVGGDGPGAFTEDIGVAYNAQYISAKVLDEFNSFCCASVVIDGAQWMLDPDGNVGTDDFPHVINNSWYFFSEVYTGFHATVAAWRAAGIIPVFCQGNEGPASATTRPPANYNNAIGVGATDAADVIGSFSSRGPSPAGGFFPADQRKPDISAPGVSVRSSLPGNTYASWSGTSMATPHVAGVVALMLENAPALTYTQIYDALTATVVDLGTVGYDFDYGYGRLDALAAVAQTTVSVPGVASSVSWLRVAPNPFRSGVRVDVDAALGANLMLDIFDPAGRRVATRAVGTTPGAVVWDGRDGAGRTVSPGVYFLRLSGAESAATTRVLRIR